MTNGLFGGKAKKNVVVVHLNDEGNISAIQRSLEPQYVTGNYPVWLRERVALLKMADQGVTLKDIQAYKVNPYYYLLHLTKKELTEIGKMLGT
jgi:hypothetical protein